MLKKYIFFLLLSIVIISGCKSNNSNAENETVFISVLEDGSRRYAQYSDTLNSKIRWYSSDKIGLYLSFLGDTVKQGDLNTVIPLNLSNSKTPFGAKAGSFEGIINVPSPYFRHNYLYSAIYPYKPEYNTYPISAVRISIPPIQNPSLKWCDNSCDFLFSNPRIERTHLLDEGLLIDFERLFPILKIEFDKSFSLYDYAGKKVSRVTLSGDQRLCGDYLIDFTKGKYRTYRRGFGSITLDFTDSIENVTLENLTAWFILDEGEYNRLSLSVDLEDMILFFENIDINVSRNKLNNFTLHTKDISSSRGVTGSYIEIPDLYFKEWLIKRFDLNDDGEISQMEANMITEIDCRSIGIYSLKGIEYFYNLESLNCSDNKISSILFNGQNRLRILNCSDNRITNLEISSCLYLEHLNCSDNQLENINISNLHYLRYLTCSKNRISSLEFPDQTSLYHLDCSDNNIQHLNLNDCKIISQIYCQNNDIERLDLRNKQRLNLLFCQNNNLTSLQLSGSNDLTLLECENNRLTSLNLDNLRLLKSAICNNNLLQAVFLKNCISLSSLNCHNNRLTSLSLKDCANLEILNCMNNNLEELDLSNKLNLKFLNCSNKEGGKKISSLNISGAINLTELICNNNRINTIKTNDLLNLERLDCSNNYLKELALMLNNKLELLLCSNNYLTELNLRGNENLRELNCSFNEINSIDIDKCSNLRSMNIHHNKIPIARISSNYLNYIDCSHNIFEQITVTKAPNLTYFDCSSNQHLKRIRLKVGQKIPHLKIDKQVQIIYMN